MILHNPISVSHINWLQKHWGRGHNESFADDVHPKHCKPDIFQWGGGGGSWWASTGLLWGGLHAAGADFSCSLPHDGIKLSNCQVNPTWSTRGLRQLMKLMKSNQTEEATTWIEKGEVFNWRSSPPSWSTSSVDLSGESWSCSLLCCSPCPTSHCADSFGEGGEGRHHLNHETKVWSLATSQVFLLLIKYWRVKARWMWQKIFAGTQRWLQPPRWKWLVAQPNSWESYCSFSFQAGNLDVVKSLLGAGAKVDARDKYGLTALHKVWHSGCLVQKLDEMKHFCQTPAWVC